jgi:hypothetical protein
MTGGPHAAEITVRETLDLFDGALAEAHIYEPDSAIAA